MADNVYASIAQLKQYGIAAAALSNVDVDVLNAALRAASAQIDESLGAQFVLPIVSWGVGVTDVCCELAAYRALAIRGFNPDTIDENIRKMYEDALKRLERWASDKGAVPAVVDSSPNAAVGVPTARASFTSDAGRGWSTRGLTDGRAGIRIPFSGGR